MINRIEGDSRTSYLLRVASEYIADNPEQKIDYDDTTCDGYCLSEELSVAADAMDKGASLS